MPTVKIKSAAAVLATAFVFAACSGGNGGSSLPTANNPTTSGLSRQSVVVKANPNVAGIYGGGATFPAYAYNGAVQAPNAPPTGSIFNASTYLGSQNIEYCLTGSGFGKRVFTGVAGNNANGPCAPNGSTPTGFGGPNVRPDFAGSDQALLVTEYQQYVVAEKPANGEPFEAPSIGGPIVFAFQSQPFPGLAGGKRLKLSQATYCGITDGTIGNWNDPAIQADNGGSITGGISRPITFYYRADGSGTTFLFQTHLKAVCPGFWSTTTPGKNWVGPTGTQASGSTFTDVPVAGGTVNGNPGEISAIQTMKYSTGYVEGGYAASFGRPHLGQAVLANASGAFADPTLKSNVTAALAGTSITLGGSGDSPSMPLGSSRPECILYIDPSTFTNPTAANAYPIVGLSYLLFYGQGNGATGTGNLGDLQKLETYLAGAHTGGSPYGNEYAYLPAAIRNTVKAAALGTSGVYKGNACIQ